MPPRCSLPPIARTRRASRNRPRRVKSSQIGISSASNIASKSFAWSAAIRRTIAVVSGFSARPKFLVDATLTLPGIGGRCPWSYLTSKPPFEQKEAFGGVGGCAPAANEGQCRVQPVLRLRRRKPEGRGRPSAQYPALSQPPHASSLMNRACRPGPMADIGFPELLTLVQTVAIIAAIVIAVYFSRLQIQALKTDTEARVVNDLDEKLHRMGEIFMEKPEFVRILNDDAAISNFGAEVAFAFYVMFFCSHAYHMRQRGILSDNDWEGWLQWTKNAFRSGRLGKYWKEAEMQAWVDPAFREFVNREILGSNT